MAFKKTINSIRENELSYLIKLAIGRAIEKCLSNSIVSFSLIATFALAAKFDIELTFPKIFFTLEIMTSLMLFMGWFSSGIGMFYEVKNIFGRFGSALSINNQAMIQIKENN